MLVSFRDRQSFDTKSSYVQHRSCCCNNTGTYHSSSEGSVNKAWRGVNFAPRYHQTRLSSPKFSFRNKTTALEKYRMVTNQNGEKSCWDNTHKLSRRSTQQTNIQRNTENSYLSQGMNKHFPTYRDKAPTAPFKRDFQRNFRPLLPRDDAVDRVQQWQSFMMVKQYKNPQPFDHRGLDIDIPNTQLRTLMTPDPQNIRFKTRYLTDEYKQSFTDNKKEYSMKDRDFTFNTHKTPELCYDKSLLHSIGRYSPAYSAYNAYLDRVNKTVSMD